MSYQPIRASHKENTMIEYEDCLPIRAINICDLKGENLENE